MNLLFFVIALLITPQIARAQVEIDCRKIYDQEDYKCLGVFNKCNQACVDKAYAEMSLTIDGGQVQKDCVKSSRCHEQSAECSQIAKDNYQDCLNPQPVKGKLPVFIDEWFRLMSAGVDLLVAEQELTYTLEKAFFGKRQPLEFTPEWFEMKAREAQRMHKKLGLTVEAKTEPKVIEDGPVKIIVQPENNKPGLLDMYPKPFLRSGSVDVRVTPQQDAKFEMETEFLDLMVKGTEFSLIHDSDNKMSAVIVYQGKVEVKPKGGKAITLTPVGSKPVMVTVARKLSVAKLSIIGVVSIAIFGGIFWKVRKKSY